MALGELGAVGAVDQRDVGEDRHLPVHRPVDQRLARGVGQVVVAADHVGHAHVVVVDDDREHVGRRAVRAQQDQVVERLVLPGDAALHHVVDHGLALARRAQADDVGARRARSPGRRRARASGTAAGGPRPSPARGTPRSPRRSRSSGRRCRARPSRGRPRRGGRRASNWLIASPSQSRPSQRSPSKIAAVASGRRAGAVGVLDAQQEGAAGVAGVEPVEQRGARAADVQVAGRRRREAGDDRAVVAEGMGLTSWQPCSGKARL